MWSGRPLCASLSLLVLGLAACGGPSTSAEGARGSSSAVTEQLLFADDFNRSIPPDDGLGASWTVVAGAWFVDGSGAETDADGVDRALASPTCGDGRVEATVTGFGAPEIGLVLRAAPSGDRYELVLLGSGSIVVRRVRGGVATTLGQAASGLSDVGSPARLTLAASGSGPVTLVATVNGQALLQLTDGSSAAIGAAGRAGLTSTSAGVVFDDFALYATSGTATVDAGVADLAAPADLSSPPRDLSATADLSSPPPDLSAPPADLSSSSATPTFSVSFADTTHQLLAVDAAGNAYALDWNDSGAQVWLSTDGARTWSPRGTAPGEFDVMSPLADGTLLADVATSKGDALYRSTDHGATWKSVLALGKYKLLHPRSVAELDGTVYLLEYQTYTDSSVPITLFASTDGGATWSSRFVFQGHRHGHGLRADAARHRLWAYFGDSDAQSGIFLSSNAGASWTKLLGNQDGDVVDAAVLPSSGDLLFGQDISFLPTVPSVARLSASGQYTILQRLPGPSYSIEPLPGGGFVLGTVHELGGDVYAPGDTSAHLLASGDGASFTRFADFAAWDPNGDDVRADVYFVLPSGEVTVQLYDVAGFGANSVGYELLRRTN